ncbi:hypothetical protein GCM10019017_17250 [Streptomyces showdoensis]
MRGVGEVSGQSQGDVGLDGDGELARPAVEGAPGAVLTLLAPDEEGGGAGGLRVQDAEELAQQEVFGVHGDVGLQVALPPALGVLAAEEVPYGAFRGLGGGGFEGRSPTVGAV